MRRPHFTHSRNICCGLFTATYGSWDIDPSWQQITYKMVIFDAFLWLNFRSSLLPVSGQLLKFLWAFLPFVAKNDSNSHIMVCINPCRQEKYLEVGWFLMHFQWLNFRLVTGQFWKVIKVAMGILPFVAKNDPPKLDASTTWAKTVPKTHNWQYLLSTTTKIPGKGERDIFYVLSTTELCVSSPGCFWTMTKVITDIFSFWAKKCPQNHISDCIYPS